MGFNEEYLKLRKKREEEDEEVKSSVPYQRPLNTEASRNAYRDKAISGDTDDIAPTPNWTDKKSEGDGLFQKGVFDDGYQFGDVAKTILGTAGDVTIGVAKGAVGLAEGLSDLLMYGGAGAASLLGNKDFSEELKKEAARSYTDVLFGKGEEFVEDYSILGNMGDMAIEGVGQILGLSATGGLGAVGKLGKVGQSILTNGILGASSAGNAMSEAYLSGAEDGEAGAYGAMSGAITVGTEMLFGSVGKFINALGFSRGLSSLDDVFAKKLSSKMSSTFFKNLTEWGVKSSFEGFEEVLEGYGSAVAKKLTYMSDEELSELVKNENLLESFLVGTLASGLTQSGAIPGMTQGGLIDTTKKGEDFITGLTKSEQAVIDKVYNDRIAEADGKLTNKDKKKIYDEVMNDFEKGYISTDTIEEVLGGEDYSNYQSELKRQQDIDNELKTLRNMKSGDMTDIQIERMAELKAMKPNTELVKSLKFGIDEKIHNALTADRNGKGSYLLESYNERARRGQAFEADLSKYDSKQQAVIKKAIESGVLNNTNRTHDFVDMVAKISADKGVLFDFANNAKLKESGFAVDGKFVNGYVTKDGITVNIDSDKALNSIVGHEITHVLEGTELYAALKVSIARYAKSKGEYHSRLNELTNTYKAVKDADVNAELTADLVGDYLFTDSDFINHLSVTNRNVFQKIWDEIKYLYKIATAGSKQARELEKVKRAFEKAYRESGQKNTAEKSGAKYSLIGKTAEGIEVYETSQDIMKLTWSERKAKYLDVMKNEYRGRTAKFKRNGHTYYAQFDQGSIKKPIYGDARSSPNGVKALIKAGADGDVFDLVENSQYDGSKANTKNHTKADYFDYFVKTVQIDGKVFDLVADVEKKYGVDGGYVYTLALQDNKKIKASPTTGTSQSEPFQNVGNAFDGIISQNSEKSIENTKFSLSDSDGNKLTQEQAEFFKDSKMRDENGNLKVMYHGSQDAGFHTFDAKMSDDDTSFFFVDRNEVATTYSGTSETYAPKAFKSVEDANKFFAEIDADEYEVVERDGKYTLLDDGDEIATSDDLAEIYEEWRDWSGLGYGDANYKVYLNLTNPLEIDAEGRNWNNVTREYSQEVADRYHSLTADERAALTDLAEWGEYGIFRDEILSVAKAIADGKVDDAYADIASAYKKLGGANANLYDAFSIASENFSEESIKQFAAKQMNTRDFARKAKAEGYDGVIFKNIHDNGGYSNGSEGASTVAIAFESNQIKSVANDKPTADMDIRYSLSETDKTYLEAVKRGDMETAQQMVYDAAKQAGYTDDMSYKMQHSAPNSKDDVSLYDLKKSGLVPNDYWDHPEWYTYGAEERESFYKIKDALTKQERWDAEGKTNYKGEPAEATIWVYRAVDKTVNSKEDNFRNGDWVTPSYDYAVNEGQMNPNGYRIIKQRVSIKDLYWDGNSIAELGYDDGKKYAYRDTVNNRKLLDPVTYDNYGKVIPLSKRFKYRNSDARYSLSDTNETPKKYGNYNVYGKDIRLPGVEDIAPMVVAKYATTIEKADYLPEDYAPIENSYTIEQELDEIQVEIDALVEEGTALYNKGDEEAATRLMLRINELSDRARTLTERANALKAQEEADYMAYIDSITDADMPMEAERAYSEAETTPLDDKSLKKLTKGVRDILSCLPKENKAIRELIEKYSTSEQTKSELFKELREKFGEKYEYRRYSDIAEVKKHLKNTKFAISDQIKGDIADFGDFKKQHGIRNSKNALSVDQVYEELSGLFPGVFSPDITNETDRLERIAEVSSMPAREWVKVAELTDNEIMQAVDFIYNSVTEYRNNAARKAAEADARAYIDDIAPSRASEITKNVSDPTLNYQGIHRETPIKTVKERIAEKLSNLETELVDNKRLRADSIVDFNREIARLQDEYNEKANKNTKAANDILRRIERLQRMRNNVDADYEKRISDLEEKKAKLSQEARTGTSATEQSIMRAELHLSKIDNMRAEFAKKGKDFDKAFKNAKDLSTFATVDNTPQRVMEKALGYEEGQILADLTVNKVAQNETEGIKWLNSYTDRKNGLIARISKQYNIKPGSKESAAAQMFAEGFYVNKDNEIIKYGDNELAMDFPDAKVQANIKGLARDTRIRKIYDETLDMINESRARNAYPEIQKLDNYFLHFRAMDDTFSKLGLPFNPNDIRAKDLPTDLNGVTANLKPGQPYFASAKHREGIKTSYDLLGGLERYLSSAKNQIYHIDDIQTLRALRNHIADTYGQAKGLEDLDSLSEVEAQERIKDVFDGHLSTFAKFLHEEANVIAGKTTLIDRGLEGIVGRRGVTFMSELNKQVGANMVGYNVSSSLTNFIAPVQAFAKTNKAAFVKGFAQTVSNKISSIAGKTDGFAENSPVMIRRKGAERFYRTPFQKVGDAGYVLMGAVDDISTEIIARAKYNELTAKGMSAEQAHFETDKWVSRLMGDRSLGQMPQLYNSKTLGLITKFQLEVRNQLDSQFYDTIQEAKAENADIENALERNSKTAAKVALVFTELAIAQHLFGKVFESIAGYNPAFDIIEVLMTALGFDDDEESEDTALDNIEQGFLALLEDLPYTSTFTGGRIPISSALPISELIKGEDEYGNEKSRLKTLGEIAPYYIMPGGYGQLKKTVQGLGMFSDDHPIAGSYTDSGKLRFPVDDTLANRVQAGIFGQWASGNARDYFDNERAPLNEKQTQEFIDVGMTIQGYWKYREGLKGLNTIAEKADYINSLDLTVDQKNILINNLSNRKEDIDMTGYDNYESFEEFDFAYNNTDKYAFLRNNGITYEQYASADDDTRAAYNWAFENPEKFTLSKAVADNVVTYRKYTKELYELKADKDEDGKSIVGSRKEKVIDYVNNLDADYGARLILFKSEYPADDTYNYDIIDYLNNREDISYEQMKTILIELGFTVDSNGNITWD